MLNFYSADTSSMNWIQKLFARSIIFTFFVKHGYSYAIKWYTQLWKPADMPFDKIPTHVSVGKIKAGHNENRYIIFESEERQKISQWDNPHYSFVYLKNGMPFYDEEIFWEHVDSTEKKLYAILQLFAFVWRYILKKYFNKEMQKNWFPENQVCSEQGYNDMKKHHDKHKIFKFSIVKLIRRNSNLFAPIDMLNICMFAKEMKEGMFTHEPY